jgi:hypothetical protein
MKDQNSVSEIKDGYAEYFFSRGSQLDIYLYEVPQLDFSEEDIKIEISLTVKRGNLEPVVAAALCERNDTSECLQGFS